MKIRAYDKEREVLCKILWMLLPNDIIRRLYFEFKEEIDKQPESLKPKVRIGEEKKVDYSYLYRHSVVTDVFEDTSLYTYASQISEDLGAFLQETSDEMLFKNPEDAYTFFNEILISPFERRVEYFAQQVEELRKIVENFQNEFTNIVIKYIPYLVIPFTFYTRLAVILPPDSFSKEENAFTCYSGGPDVILNSWWRMWSGSPERQILDAIRDIKEELKNK